MEKGVAKMANREKFKKRIRIGLSVVELIADIGILYLTYKLYKLSEEDEWYFKSLALRPRLSFFKWY